VTYEHPPRDDSYATGPEGEDPSGDGSETRRETHRVRGDDLLQTVKRIVREGNARRIVIKNEEDRVLLEFPLAAGVVGAAFLPVWAAVGAVAALVTNCSIEVERKV
jgi:hypothetical protein